MAIIYRKTVKGQTEFEARSHRLAPRFRSVLVLVDGRRSDEELRGMLLRAGSEVFEALAAGGFIEPVAVTADRPLPAVAALSQGFAQRA